MAVTLPRYAPLINPYKRRRTATAVLAGEFDPRSRRPQLGNCIWLPEDEEEEVVESMARSEQKAKDALVKESDKGKEVVTPQKVAPQLLPRKVASGSESSTPKGRASASKKSKELTVEHFTSLGRPHILIPRREADRRSVSFTPPPPLPVSPGATPAPTQSSATSRTSSKRPRTPEDEEEMVVLSAPLPPPPKKKRAAARKGWKGWVEGSPEPSDKLINLDAVPVITAQRKLRSGKQIEPHHGDSASWA